MKKRSLFIAGFLALAFPAGAQEIDPQCPPGNLDADGDPDNAMIAQDACQKAIDLFRYMAPQLGAVLAGGSPTQGYMGNLGRLGRFSLGIRANALQGSLPEVDRVVPNTRGAQQSNYTIDTNPIGFVTADMGVGLFKGFGASGLGSFDLLVSASFLPEYSGESIEVSLPAGSLKLGLGGKVGLLGETAARPGVSLSILDRSLPTVDITGTSGDDRLLLDDVEVRSRSWRLTAGKSFMFLGIGAGYGRDSYDSKASVTVIVAPRAATTGGTGGPIALAQNISRNNMFATVWIKSTVVRLVGEIGRVSGGTITTYNLFTGTQPADARTYASFGVAIGP